MTYSYADFNLFRGLVVFNLNTQFYCADLDEVFAIVNPVDLSPAATNSILNNHKLSIERLSLPVIDLHALFTLKFEKLTEQSRFLCMEKMGQSFSFAVDRIEEIALLDDKTRLDYKFSEYRKGRYLSGKVKHNKNVYYLPNFKNIINDLFSDQQIRKEGLMNLKSEHPP